MILGKSTHPVEIKQIPLRTWSLRSEIEVALELCLKEDGTLDEEAAQKIKELYENISYPDIGTVTKLKADEPSDSKEEKKEEENKSEETTDETTELADTTTDDSKERVLYTPKDEEIGIGRSLLSDIHMDSIIFFSEKVYTRGQTITLEIITAKPFRLHLIVENIMNFSRDSKIITPRKLGYRILGKFLFHDPEQKINLRQFLEKVEPELVTQEREKKAEDEQKKKNDPLEQAEQAAKTEKVAKPEVKEEVKEEPTPDAPA